MLKDLFGSKTRQTLLKAFFETPDAEYYTRQLEALHHISVGTLHRELKKLTSAGILKTRKIGNIKLFSLNKENAIYEEIKNIIQKTEGVVNFVKDSISGVKGVRSSFVYGSFAKGDERPDSDIDIFFIGDDIDEDDLIVKIGDLEKKLFRDVNYTLYAEEEYRKKKKSRDSFVLEVVKGKKIFLKGDEGDL
jgi:predicted nucleotidyltransferase